MPRGAKPKTYPPELVAQVGALYQSGMTQSEVARALSTSQKIVHSVMRRHGIKARRAAKRDQRGAKNSGWKGDAAGYQAMHIRVETLRGKPSHCETCGTKTAKAFDWANLSGNYQDPWDYKRLCRSCHHRLDGKVRNLRRKEVASA